ncbi:MAG: ribonuclease P protein component [Deltaproteobacteria bacterium]|nr:ribonuclease P protein component [Deltaproteobacteria bacterium]
MREDNNRRKNSFSKRHRLCRRGTVNQVFLEGKVKKVGYLRFRYLQWDSGYSKIVISISKRTGNAPTRNRYKRLIREVLRQSSYLRSVSIICGIHIAVSPRTKPTFSEVKELIDTFYSSLSE